MLFMLRLVKSIYNICCGQKRVILSDIKYFTVLLKSNIYNH